MFICHFGQRMELWNLNGHVYEVSQLGRYGVELFFVISGYLVCYSLSKGKSIVEYYKKRIIRIMPLYYFCILYYFVTETFLFRSVPADPQHLGWIRYILCLNGIVISDGYFWGNIGITWTIPVFLMFYLFAPLIVKISKSTIASVVLLVGLMGIHFIINRTIPGWLHAFDYFPCFIFGILVFNAKKENKRFITMLGLSIFVLVFKWVSFDNFVSEIIDEKYVVSALFAIIVLFTERFTMNSKRAIKVFDVLDEHSFTLYLVHGIVFCGIIDKFEINIYFRIAIAIIGTFILTVLVHKYIEKPIRKLFNRVLLH